VLSNRGDWASVAGRSKSWRRVSLRLIPWRAGTGIKEGAVTIETIAGAAQWLQLLFAPAARITLAPVHGGSRSVARLLPIALIGLTACITTAMVEAVYFACYLWRSAFGEAVPSFSWSRPLPVAGGATAAVLFVGWIVARLMRPAREDALEGLASEHDPGNDRQIEDPLRVI
jgi:hypothetical protein